MNSFWYGNEEIYEEEINSPYYGIFISNPSNILLYRPFSPIIQNILN